MGGCSVNVWLAWILCFLGSPVGAHIDWLDRFFSFSIDDWYGCLYRLAGYYLSDWMK